MIILLVDQYMPWQLDGPSTPLRYVAGAGLLIAFLWMSHRVLPSRDMSGFHLLPGIIASTVIWGLTATALSIYVSYTPGYQVTYGSLAGVIVTLLFFYLTAISIILGVRSMRL